MRPITAAAFAFLSSFIFLHGRFFVTRDASPFHSRFQGGGGKLRFAHDCIFNFTSLT